MTEEMINVDYTIDEVVTTKHSIAIDPAHFLEVTNLPLRAADSRVLRVYLERTGRLPHRVEELNRQDIWSPKLVLGVVEGRTHHAIRIR